MHPIYAFGRLMALVVGTFSLPLGVSELILLYLEIRSNPPLPNVIADIMFGILLLEAYLWLKENT